jgi:hypothetical protein
MRSNAAAGACGWQIYRHLFAGYIDDVGSLTSRNPIDLHGLLQGQRCFPFCYVILLITNISCISLRY